MDLEIYKRESILSFAKSNSPETPYGSAIEMQNHRDPHSFMLWKPIQSNIMVEDQMSVSTFY